MDYYTAHVYDSDGLPDKNSELDCTAFASLEEAKAAALTHCRENGGIVDITRDREDSPDPEFLWSTQGQKGEENADD